MCASSNNHAQVADIVEVLEREADELGELCKRNGPHDICEFCEMGGMLLRAVFKIRTLREAVHQAQAHLDRGDEADQHLARALRSVL